MNVITSTANPRIKSVRELHRAKGRKERHQTLIEGPAVFEDFLDAGFVPVTVLCTPDDIDTIDACRRSEIGCTLVTAEVLSVASDTRTAQGPVAVIDLPEPAHLRAHNTVVLVDIADPGNAGTTIRTAAAFDWDIAYTVGTADPWSPKTVRSAAGAHTRVNLVLLSDPIENLSAVGLQIIATVVKGGAPPIRSRSAVALLIGSEAHGLAPEMVKAADATMTIPMPGEADSLNAAIAAAIAIFALS